MKKVGILCTVVCGLLLSAAFGADPVKLPPKEKFYLVLLAGQSNMAGRGKIQPEDRTPYLRVLMLNQEGEWVPASAPVHFDKSFAGIGPGDAFAKLLAGSDPSITVGLIPAACGGSSIRHWRPGVYWEQTQSHPYDDAVARTRKALESGTLKAILWHQGEADCNKNADRYARWLTELIRDFRQKFNAPDVPVIVGQLSQFPGANWSEAKRKVDAAQRKAVEENQPAAFVTSEGLTSNSDKVHFDRASQLEFGRRYFEAWRKLIAR